jgi:hypothetical protein
MAAPPQWPCTLTDRRAYANFLVDATESNLSAIAVAGWCAGGLMRSPTDGFYEFVGTPLTCTARYAPPAMIAADRLVELATVCMLIHHDPLLVTNLAYSRCVAAAVGVKPFWHAVYGKVSWMTTASIRFATLLCIPHTGITSLVLDARRMMGAALQSNTAVDHALTLMAGGGGYRRPWVIRPGTRMHDVLWHGIVNAQIEVRAVNILPDGDGQPPAGRHVDVQFTATDGLVMAERDRLLLVILFMYQQPNGLLGPKHQPWCCATTAPALPAFVACKATYPTLFTAAAAAPPTPSLLNYHAADNPYTF